MNEVFQNKVINTAVTKLKKGGIIIIPTETVYGIAVDATNKFAIEKIYTIKNRERTKPLQIMCRNIKEATEIANISDEAYKFCNANWPGALTAIFKIKKGSKISENFNKIDNSIGIRVPNHELAFKIIQELGSPIAVSSANLSGEVEAVNLNSLNEDIKNSVDFLIDGGEASIKKPSTIIDFRVSPPKILRQGSVKFQAE